MRPYLVWSALSYPSGSLDQDDKLKITSSHNWYCTGGLSLSMVQLILFWMRFIFCGRLDNRNASVAPVTTQIAR